MRQKEQYIPSLLAQFTILENTLSIEHPVRQNKKENTIFYILLIIQKYESIQFIKKHAYFYTGSVYQEC